MNYIVAFFSLTLGVFAFVVMSDISGGGKASFDYKTASAEERQAWMDDKAKDLRRAAKFFLPSGRGPMALNFYLRDIVTRPDASSMEVIIDVKVPYGAEVGVIPKHQFLETFCKNYKNAGFYEQRIQMIVSFRNKKNGNPITRITVEPHDCQYHT